MTQPRLAQAQEPVAPTGAFDPDDLARLVEEGLKAADGPQAEPIIPPEGWSAGHWRCNLIDRLPDFVYRVGDLTLNNFQLREATEFGSRVPQAELDLSAVNRGAAPISLSVQFLGLRDGGEPVIALSARPSFGMVSSRSNGEIKAAAHVTPGEVDLVDQFCLRVDGGI